MSIKEKLHLDWIWLKLSYPFRWAHHPTCDPYASQRFEIQLGETTLHLCQGCTLVTISSILSFVTILLLILFTNLLSIPLLLGLMLFPILPVVYIDGQGLSRNYKRLARLLLGVGTGTALSTILFYPSWWFKGIVVVSLLAAKFGYETLRSQSPSADLCQTCELLDEAPYCPGMIDKMEANKRYQELALPIVNSSIEETVLSKYEPPVNPVSEQVNNDKVTQQESEQADFDVIWMDDQD